MAIEIKPQEGFQENFLSTEADIAIGGSGAGVGKTHALLIEPLRHINNSKFSAVFFRRSYPQIKMAGGIMDKTRDVYPLIGADFNKSDFVWNFPSGAEIKLSQLQYEDSVLNYQGSEICLIMLDELTHFSEYQFFYMLSRNRSTCGVRPYVRATCNPDPNSWVAKFIEWWIDEETGFPIPERAGKIRYFFRHNEEFIWADSKAELLIECPSILILAKETNSNPEDLIKSVSFIPGKITENKILLAKDPGYIANLHALDDDEKSRLLDGNWKVSLDKKMIADYAMVDNVFDNFPDKASGSYITVDAAKMGRDLMVALVWKGWEIVYIAILTMSSTADMRSVIERLRAKFGVIKSNVIVDQDGAGHNTVKLGGYRGYHGAAQPLVDRDPKTSRRRLDRYEYGMLKDQLIYRFLELRVNTGGVRYNVSSETVEVDGEMTTKIKFGKKYRDVKDLIKEDLRSYRRLEGEDTINDTMKKRVETKDLQKIILKGRSPDLGDPSYLREYFEMKGVSKGVIV